MASVDGKKSYLSGSDEVHLSSCGPCKDDGDDKEAKHYCENCDEYLCNDCKDYHRKFKVTKTHKILPASLSPRRKPVAVETKFRITCNCNQNLEVEYYCNDDAEVMCSSCETIKHRKCQTSPLQDKVSNYSMDQFSAVLEKAKALKHKMETYQRDRETDCQKVEKMKEECRKEINNFRQEICNALDKMEETVVKALDEKAKQQLMSIEKQIASLSLALRALDLDEDLLENVNKAATENAMFAADVKTSKNLQQYEALVVDLEKNEQRPRLVFEKNKKLADLRNDIGSLGKIAGNEIEYIHETKHVILDMKIKSSDEVNIKLPDDEKDPSITGCAFLPNGSIVLCDNKNSNLKLLDNNWTVKESLPMSNAPWNVAAINDNDAVVTFSTFSVQKLQVIHIIPQMKLGKEIALQNICFGIEVVGGDIYTTCHKKSGEDEIWKLDQSGNIKSKVSLVQNASGRPYYLCLGTSEKNPHIYLTDFNKSILACLKHDGTIVFQYKDEGLKRANGLYVDSEGNTLVCGTNSNNVVIITADGKKHRELLTSKNNITKPMSIAFRADNGTLVVGCEYTSKSSKLFVYRLAR